MSLLQKIITTTLTLVIFSCNFIYSQEGATPLEPEKSRLQSEFGFFAGLGANFQSGIMTVDCENCNFENGSKFGLSFGALYERELFPGLRAGIMFSYENLSVSSSFREIEGFTFFNEASQANETLPLSVRHEAITNLSLFSISPYLKWAPAKFFFTRVAFKTGLIASSNIKHTKYLLQKSTRLSTGEYVEVSFEDGETEAVVQDGEPEDIITPQLHLSPAIGFNIPLSINVFLSPLFEYSIPLTNINERNNFQINYWRIIIELRIALTLRNY